jgi:hypothetical protein
LQRPAAADEDLAPAIARRLEHDHAMAARGGEDGRHQTGRAGAGHENSTHRLSSLIRYAEARCSRRGCPPPWRPTPSPGHAPLCARAAYASLISPKPTRRPSACRIPPICWPRWRAPTADGTRRIRSDCRPPAKPLPVTTRGPESPFAPIR